MITAVRDFLVDVAVCFAQAAILTLIILLISYLIGA